MTDRLEDLLVAIPCPECGCRIEESLAWWIDAKACPHCFRPGRMAQFSQLFRAYVAADRSGQVLGLRSNDVTEAERLIILRPANDRRRAMAKTSGKSVKGKSVGRSGAEAAVSAAQPGKVPMELVHEKARQVGLVLDGFTKKESVIRSIQIAEGYQGCFGTPLVETCGQKGCCWREECRGG